MIESQYLDNVWRGIPEEEAAYIEQQRLQSIPHDISMRQCWLYLDAMPPITGRNVLDIINEDIVPTLPRRARLEWDARPPVWRSSPMVEQMRQMFGWTAEQMDQMFRDASEL